MLRMVEGFMFSRANLRFPMIKKKVGAGPRSIWGRWNGIGGKVEPGESNIDAMVREFKEETGVETKPSDWDHFLTHVVPYRGEIYFYRMFADEELVKQARTMEEEEVGHWFPWSLPEELVHNLRWIIPMALDDTQKWAISTEKS